MDLMKTHSVRTIFLCLALAACICLFTACSPVLKVAVATDGSITYSVESSVSPLIEDTVRSFTGAGEELPLFNKAQILQALLQKLNRLRVWFLPLKRVNVCSQPTLRLML